MVGQSVILQVIISTIEYFIYQNLTSFYRTDDAGNFKGPTEMLMTNIMGAQSISLAFGHN